MNGYFKFNTIIIALILLVCITFCSCGQKDPEQTTDSITDNVTSSAEENTVSSELPTTNTQTEISTEEVSSTEQVSAVPENTTAAAEITTKTPETTAAPVETTKENVTKKPEVVETTTAAQNTAVPSTTYTTTAQIVELYNSKVNIIKSRASSITRNYKHLKSLDEYLSLPSAIRSLGKVAMDTFVKGSNEPQYWTSKEDFQIGFPVGNTDYTSKLTESMVKSAVCMETDSAYEITLILFDDAITSPAKGEGYAGIFNTVTASTFEDINIPGITFETVKVNGINGEIRCTVDKQSMNITEITFKNTDILDLGVKFVASNLNAKFALASEENFTIKY